MESDDPVTAYRRFLEHFSNKIDNLSSEEYEAPFRLSTFYLVPSEVEGECLEWSRRYLSLHECPNGLLPQLSRAVYRNLQAGLNLPDYYIELDDKDSSNEDDDDDDVDCDNNSQGSTSSDNLNNSNPPQLYASKLLQEVISHVHVVVKEWARATPNLLTPPTSLHVCAHAIKNTRRKMEDRHVIMNDLNSLFDLKDNPSQAYFSVFDGHGGLEAADYAATHLHMHLVRDGQFDLDPASAMKQAYKMTDMRFLEKAARENLRCGTTGVSALIRDSHLYLGWLGDSQALLVRAGQPLQIMNPHKPEREDERRRIEDLGGCVLYFGAWRVNGNISVSRAIGDAPHKPFICSDADVTTVTLTGEEEYLVLACDGLWDVLSPAEVTQVVYKHSHSSPGGLDDVAIGLVNAARDAGSSDNISVVVVLFKSTLSVPQTTGDAAILLGLNTLSDKTMDQLNNSSSANTFNFPKPPTLNEKLKSKGKTDLQDGKEDLIDGSSSSDALHYHSRWTAGSRKPSLNSNHSRDVVVGGTGGSFLNGKGSAQNLSADMMSTPFSHDLMRQAMFYISKRPPQQVEDTRLVEMALRQAMSGEKVRKKQKENIAAGAYSKKSGVKEPQRPGVRSFSSRISSSQFSRPQGQLKGGSRKRQKKRNRTKSLAGETIWGVTSDSEEEWGVAAAIAAGDVGYFRENSTASVSSMMLSSSNKGVQKSPRKLKPLQVKGTTLAAAAVAEASRWVAEKNIQPMMELSGTSLPLSSRTALPRILQSREKASNGAFTYNNDFDNYSKFAIPFVDGGQVGVVPAHMRPRRGVSTLSDTGILHSQHNGRGGGLNFETASQYSDSGGVSHRSRRGRLWQKK
ncbi:uncharacterized protein LOC101861112 [Aplysia californica]|uniref:Uncharacterized protein LOC101861112 n=1 Tax=Aplysia californica TaxID=6500 RepID=A0ABM0ZX28_APLCA|nr:uncharacterized protein LOC101861112 [Aplysia californica]